MHHLSFPTTAVKIFDGFLLIVLLAFNCMSCLLVGNTALDNIQILDHMYKWTLKGYRNGYI